MHLFQKTSYRPKNLIGASLRPALPAILAIAVATASAGCGTGAGRADSNPAAAGTAAAAATAESGQAKPASTAIAADPDRAGDSSAYSASTGADAASASAAAGTAAAAASATSGETAAPASAASSDAADLANTEGYIGRQADTGNDSGADKPTGTAGTGEPAGAADAGKPVGAADAGKATGAAGTDKPAEAATQTNAAGDAAGAGAGTGRASGDTVAEAARDGVPARQEEDTALLESVLSEALTDGTGWGQSAGSSLRAAAAATRLLQWACMARAGSADDAALAKAVAAEVARLSPAQRQNLHDNWSFIAYDADTILDQMDEIEGILEDAGCLAAAQGVAADEDAVSHWNAAAKAIEKALQESL